MEPPLNSCLLYTSYPEELPTGAPMADENAMLDDIFTTVGQNASVLDLRPTFTADKNEYLYFKTDHHWTPNGAYRAYEQFCAMKGLTPFDRDAHESITVTDFQGTHYSATRLWNVENDEITYYPVSDTQLGRNFSVTVPSGVRCSPFL